MSSSASKCPSSTPTMGKAPRKALKVFRAKRSAPKNVVVDKQNTPPTATTTDCTDKDSMVMERVEAYYGRKRTIEDIMSSEAPPSIDSSAPGRVGKRQICRKRKAVPKGITSVPSSSSSSEHDDSESSQSSDEADIQDGTDVVDYNSQGTVITSTIKYPESESSSSSDDDWEAKCACPDGTMRCDCTCDCQS